MREKEIAKEAVRIWKESDYSISYSKAIEKAIETYKKNPQDCNPKGANKNKY